ncbi:hypothetical protein EV182_004141, partial [Spiromyces aspiralis]
NTTDSESNSKSSSSSEVGSASSSSDESEEEQKLESVPANNAKTRNKRSASQALTPPHAAKVAKTSGHEMLKGTPQPTPTVKSRFSHLNSQTPLLAGARGEASSAMARSARRMTITPLSEMARSSKFIDLSREAQEIKAKRANASLHASPVGSGTSTPTPLTISAATNAKGATGASPASSEQDESDDDDDTSSSSSESSSGSSTNRSSSDSSDDDDDSDSGPVQLARSQSEKAATASSPHRSSGS